MIGMKAGELTYSCGIGFLLQITLKSIIKMNYGNSHKSVATVIRMHEKFALSIQIVRMTLREFFTFGF